MSPNALGGLLPFFAGQLEVTSFFFLPSIPLGLIYLASLGRIHGEAQNPAAAKRSVVAGFFVLRYPQDDCLSMPFFVYETKVGQVAFKRRLCEELLPCFRNAPFPASGTLEATARLTFSVIHILPFISSKTGWPVRK